MKTFVGKLWTGATGLLGAHRGQLTLLVVAIAAAALYAWGATGHARVRNLERWIDSSCAIAGADKHPARPKGLKGRGVSCVEQLHLLADFKRDTQAETGRVLAEAFAERNRKTDIDAQRAAESAAAARDAAARMEAANAAVGKDDRVGGDWFDALNRTAGLRSPPS